ncbi:hypothetical protein [Tessaracoccus defluvii]|uniref:Uncharacterized protein n=1 Tax=Tessaracoccus defluvii TaxID=1285901 RepID=A0A7H0H6K9_9ACTN|nr:hypothetical protein [Tessaracoccus defluvii]QNP56175.1 hypothetical protein H9L22_01290 [Tessaracoccus defluvii]
MTIQPVPMAEISARVLRRCPESSKKRRGESAIASTIACTAASSVSGMIPESIWRLI